MKKYYFDVDFSGYCRGIATFSVDAGSEEEAFEKLQDSFFQEEGECIIRDDRDFDFESARLSE